MLENGQAQVQISGVVESVVFNNPDNGYTVLELASGDELITVVGNLPGLSPGEELKIQGEWGYHSSFGRQFRASLCERKLPSNAADILRYLSSGTIKGIREKTALKIVETFGEETLEVLENDPKRLASINGISMSKALMASRDFKKQFAVREVILSLEKFGMTPNECIKAFKVFGVNAVDTIKRNPYALCGEVLGISFERADDISQKLTEPPDPSYRLDAGIIHILKKNLSNGHTCLPKEKMLQPAKDFLGCSEQQAESVIDSLVESRRLCAESVNGKAFIFLPSMYHAEKNAAKLIKYILRFPPAGRPTLSEDIDNVEKLYSIKYGEKQREAIMTAVAKGMLILTGGPGTGKTTTLNGILKLFEDEGLSVTLAAPTGRAAKRMSEVTGREAKTIHRMLEVEWGEDERQAFKRNRQNPLNFDAVVIDELSMVDVVLFSSLLEALPVGCRLVMVGDSDQLPPVGAGSVLHDLISSGCLPVVELNEVFRQAMESLIVTNAHKIVKGQMPVLNVKDKDFFFLSRENGAKTAKTICELCAQRLPKAYKYSPLSDIQVLCPSKKGDAGSVNLNRLLQEAVNPPSGRKKEITTAGRILREGDKVMQIRNNYDLKWKSEESEGTGVFNGDIGILEKIDIRAARISVRFDDRVASYPLENLKDLDHAYAITVHKSQGNEFEAVVMSVSDIVPNLAYRNLLYTAVTRAKTRLIMVGSANQIQRMVENDKKVKRYSALAHFLTENEAQKDVINNEQS